MKKLLLSIALLVICNGVIVALALIVAHALPSSPLLVFNSFADMSQQRDYVYIVDIRHRLLIQITDNASRLGYPAWSADGQLAFTQLDGNNHRWHVEVLNGTQRQIITSRSSDYRNFAWSNDHRLAFEERDEFREAKNIFIWDGETLVPLESPLGNAIGLPSWSPDGRLAFGFYQSNPVGVTIWDGREFQTILTRDFHFRYGPTVWSAQGWLAIQPATDPVVRSYISVWNGETIRNITYQSGEYEDLTWSANGWLAFVAVDNENSNWDIYVWDGEQSRKISQNPSYDRNPCWLSDGRLAFISFYDPYWQLQIWDGLSITTIISDTIRENSLTCSANGWLSFIARRGDDWDVYVWDGNTVYQVSNTGRATGQPQWSPLP